jgi:hypothetical protein
LPFPNAIAQRECNTPSFFFRSAGALLADWDAATGRDLGRIALVAFPANALFLKCCQRPYLANRLKM